MGREFSEENYSEMIEKLFMRFPSFQNAGASAYKPGIANMEFIDQLMGHPHKNYRIIHVAGTNGKGSVSNMLTSVLAASGLKVGLYTSPHIIDFRERMRVVDDNACTLVSKQYVWDFVQKWNDTFEHLGLSFFEITTIMALQWFADEKVDLVVLETGLGGRLDSTNIVSPILSLVTNIGLDHCDMLGDTLSEIAFEKAGIIKPEVPVVVGESHPETDTVFERKVLYTNLPVLSFMGNRSAIMSLLAFADKTEPMLWDGHEDILAQMDLQGAYQRKNLRTVLAALGVLAETKSFTLPSDDCLKNAIINTAKRVDFHGRWEKLSDRPKTICDIGHNAHGLRYNFAQLAAMKNDGQCTDLIIVYGSVADKDVDAVLHLMPEDAVYIFTQSQGKRALAADAIYSKYSSFCNETGRSLSDVHVAGTVQQAVSLAKELAAEMLESDIESRPLIYIGGSTYVVSEAVREYVG